LDTLEREPLHGDGQVESETHHGLGVRIHRTTTDDVKADVVLGQQGDQPIEEIPSVSRVTAFQNARARMDRSRSPLSYRTEGAATDSS